MREIAYIDSLCFTECWSEKSYLEMAENKTYSFFKEEIDKKIVGFIVLMDVVDAAEIIRVAVLPEYRGRGIGDSLIKRAENYIREKKYENIFLEVRESNKFAYNLYKKNGFEECGIRKNYYSNPKENGIVMMKRLV